MNLPMCRDCKGLRWHLGTRMVQMSVRTDPHDPTKEEIQSVPVDEAMPCPTCNSRRRA